MKISIGSECGFQLIFGVEKCVFLTFLLDFRGHVPNRTLGLETRPHTGPAASYTSQLAAPGALGALGAGFCGFVAV